ncbi:MAG: DUF1998 domain-containing protein, partial [Rhodococcus sp.]|nr:DUF1998 domain-containing protein [Rhodococcus sp. (in: high G+C Gram-positive bacteria)]
PPPAPSLALDRRVIAERVIRAELLRQAFWSNPKGPSWHSDSVHGAFGAVSDWMGQWRSHAQTWLEVAASEARRVANVALRHTPLEGSAELIADSVCEDLIAEVDGAVSDSLSYPQQQLSERLANAGLLPMFGFPTRVRPLYERRPSEGRNESSAVVADRVLDLAVGAFAPGAETLKDRRVHVAVGFARFERRGRRWFPAPDPLGERRQAVSCETCGDLRFIEAGATDPDTCEGCQADARSFNLVEPRGFLTHGRAHDYEDDVSRGQVAALPRLGIRTTAPSEPLPGRAVSVRSEQDMPVVTVNDNSGRLFKVVKSRDGFVVPNKELYARWREAPDWFKGLGSSAPVAEEVAIGAATRTDVLLITPSPAIITDPTRCPAGHSALVSLAELLRLTGARQLGVSATELRSGVQPIKVSDHRWGELRSGRIFIADILENGAGFARELGRPDRMDSVIKEAMARVRDDYQDELHASRCGFACNDCLLGYENRFIHHQLNWRLAADALELVAGGSPNEDRWLEDADERVGSFLQAWTSDGELARFEADGLLGVARGHKRLALLVPPLDGRVDADLVASKFLADFVDVTVRDYFELETIPQRIASWLFA